MKLVNQVTDLKLRGGFYTPKYICKFIIEWLSQDKSLGAVLEPSCGDGAFIKEISSLKPGYDSIDAIELDEIEAIKASNIKCEALNVLNTDFHRFCTQTTKRYDTIFGNPPYIRYQYFEDFQQAEAEQIFIRAGVPYTRLANAWIGFVIGSALLLNENGKMGFVLPAELLHVSYSKHVREFLQNEFQTIELISFEYPVFPDIQQEVVLLLCAKSKKKLHSLNFRSVQKPFDLTLENFGQKSNTEAKLFPEFKWPAHLLSRKDLEFLQKIKQTLPSIETFAKTEVGITTGANEFFSLDDFQVKRLMAEEFVIPLLGKGVEVAGICFSGDDLKTNRLKLKKSNLLVISKNSVLPKLLHEYVLAAEKIGIHNGYKCRIRTPWYSLNSIKHPDAFFLRRIGAMPKMIANSVSAVSTDTMHRIFMKNTYNPIQLTGAYYNYVSLLFTELAGRTFGGGALELMPSEVDSIPIPFQKGLEAVNLIENAFISKDLKNGLSLSSELLLKEYGLSISEVFQAKNIWETLRDRRVSKSKV